MSRLSQFQAMDKNKAAELIRQQRQRWPSEGSDEFIARRAQRGYHKMAIIFAVIGALEAGAGAYLKVRPLYFTATGFLVGAGIWHWNSRRFTNVLRVLRTSR
jgi:hypothetical protein